MTDEELKHASKQILDLMLKRAEEMQAKFNLNKTDAMLSVIADQVSVLLILEQERTKAGR